VAVLRDGRTAGNSFYKKYAILNFLRISSLLLPKKGQNITFHFCDLPEIFLFVKNLLKTDEKYGILKTQI